MAPRWNMYKVLSSHLRRGRHEIYTVIWILDPSWARALLSPSSGPTAHATSKTDLADRVFIRRGTAHQVLVDSCCCDSSTSQFIIIISSELSSNTLTRVCTTTAETSQHQQSMLSHPMQLQSLKIGQKHPALQRSNNTVGVSIKRKLFLVKTSI